MLISRPIFLLVEPSPTLRSSLNNWLEDVLPGYQIHSVSNGREALQLPFWEKVSQILIDMYLPVMSCSELIQEIRNAHPNARIAVAGWHENCILLEKLLSIGANQLIAKDKLHSELIPVMDVSATLPDNKCYSEIHQEKATPSLPYRKK